MTCALKGNPVAKLASFAQRGGAFFLFKPVFYLWLLRLRIAHQMSRRNSSVTTSEIVVIT